MRIIKPSYEIYNIPDATNHVEVLKHLEKIARICYKSEDNITAISYINFLKNIRKRQHWAMFEHYVFTISVPSWIYTQMNDLTYKLSQESDTIMKLGYFHSTYWEGAKDKKYKYLISFSATSLNRIVSHPKFVKEDYPALMQIFDFMKDNYPVLMYEFDDENETDEKYNTDISFLTRDEIKKLPNWIREVHDTMTVHFVVDRGVTHEIVRHRPASYAQESTRYCNYSHGKFSSEITVIEPIFFNKETDALLFDLWKNSCETAEYQYFKLLEYGATPQQARTILPHSVKADLIMTGTIHEFKHFFKMRCAKDAHPQMLEVTRPLLLEANNKNKHYKNMFDENMDLLK